MEKVLIDGHEYEVAHAFGPERVAIRYDGLIVLADLVPAEPPSTGTEWALSGTPASPDETRVIEALMPARDSAEVAVISDAGTD